MRRITFGFRCLACLAVASFASAATTLRTTSTASTTVLAIDGVSSGFLLSWEGGDVRGSVVTVPSSSGGLPTKHVGSAFPGPLMVQVAFPPSPELVKWINEMCANQTPRRALLLTDYDAMGVAAGAFEATGAMLTEVTFPAFDASSTTLGPMRLVFRPEQSRFVSPGTAAAGTNSLRATGSSFSLAIDGLDTKGAMRIEPITASLVVATEAVGATRDYSKAPASVQFSNLRVIANAAAAGTWTAWHTGFVVNGNNGDANEKGGSLGLIKPDGTSANFALNFGQVGILRVSRLPIARGAGPTVEAEFYFERLALGSPTVSATAASTASGTTDNTNVSEVSAGTQTNAIQQVASTDTTTPLSGGTAVMADGAPLASSTARTSPALTAALNPADQGSRDPAAFPRVKGLTRVNYDGTFQKAYTSEGASYTSTEKIYQLVGRVDAAAKAAGWIMTSLSEADTPNGKTVSEGWTKLPATASVSYLEPKDGSGTKMSLQVYVQIPATN